MVSSKPMSASLGVRLNLHSRIRSGARRLVCVTVFGEAVDGRFWRFPRPPDGSDVVGSGEQVFCKRRLLCCRCWVTGRVVPE